MLAWLEEERTSSANTRPSGPAIHAALRRIHAEEGTAAIIVEQHAQKILPITDRALILERGRVVHESASAALLADSGPLERFLGVTAR